MSDDYAEIGDDLWARFNQKDKHMHEWYYREIYKILAEVEEFRWSEELLEFEGTLHFIFD